MISFPETVEIQAHGKTLVFRITQINAVMFTIKHVTTTLKNEDGMTFGYLVYQEGFLYAYAVLPSENVEESLRPEAERRYNYHVIFNAYIGPEEEVAVDNALLEQILCAIGRTYVQHERFNNKHPGIVDSERFSQIYKALKADIDKHGFDYVTPYLTPIRQTATELRDFYTKLVEELSSLQC